MSSVSFIFVFYFCRRSNILALQTLAHFKDQLHAVIGDNDVSGRKQAGQSQLVGGFVQDIEFLKALHPGINTPEATWRTALAPIAASIEALAADPEITAANGILSLRGRLLSMDDFLRGKALHPNTALAKMFASHTTFVDASTQQEISLAVWSPKFKVVRPAVFTLRGRDGAHGSIGAPGGTGANGSHGTPGYHFLAKISQGDNLQNLSVLVKGGNGGNGGAGGDGAHGRDGDLTAGIHSQQSDQILPANWGWKRKDNELYDHEGLSIRAKDLRWGLRVDHTKVSYQARGTEGTAGGNGGQAGHGAPAGTARIIGATWGQPAANTAAGSAGTPGKGGAAGSNGRDCRGEEHISRIRNYMRHDGNSGLLGTGEGIYTSIREDLPNKTITARAHVGGGATSAGVTPKVPHGSIPVAISSIDENAFNAEYGVFHAKELADAHVRRFVKPRP